MVPYKRHNRQVLGETTDMPTLCAADNSIRRLPNQDKMAHPEGGSSRQDVIKEWINHDARAQWCSLLLCLYCVLHPVIWVGTVPILVR